MRVLFAVSNDNITTSVVNKYQQKYKEIITSKNVYYFNAIIKELQRNKTYDAVVIGEDLEPISNNNYEAIDKFLFEKLDSISDEASKPTGEDIPIILICSDRRNQSDALLIKLFGIGIYNAIIGNDRSIDTVCNLINKPRSKKEAKAYYKVDSDEITPYERTDDQDVSEPELQNILAHYRKIGPNVKKCVESFDSIADQYTETQLRIIIKFLPLEVKQILEANSPRYQKLIYNGTVLSNGSYVPYNQQNPKKPANLEILTKDIGKAETDKPIIIPSTINIDKKKVAAESQRPMKYPATASVKKIAQKPVQQSIQPIQQPAPMVPNHINQGNRPNQQNQFTMNTNEEPAMQETQGENINNMPNEFSNQNATIDNNIETKKRGRGRPRKIIDSAEQPIMVTPAPIVPTAKKRRGRPPKKNIETNANGEVNNSSIEEPKHDNNDQNESLNLFDLDSLGNTNDTQSDVLPGLDDMTNNAPINYGQSPLPKYDDSYYSEPYEPEQNPMPSADYSKSYEPAPNTYYNKPYEQASSTDFSKSYEPVQNTDYNKQFAPEQTVNYNNMYEQTPNAEYNNVYDQTQNVNYNQYANSFESMPYQQYAQNSNQSLMQETNSNETSFDNNMQSTINQNNLPNSNVNNQFTPNNNVIAGNGKLVAFVGTTKNGTSFIINNLAQLLSQKGVKTAILDLTKNKNSYYMFTDNDTNLMKIATESISNLSGGIVNGLEVNKNLTVFTSLPDGLQEETNKDMMLKTLSNNFDIALIDCDFETAPEYFTSVNEIYLIQSMDAFTIQPLTSFLSNLKLKNMLDESKLRIVINKYVKLKRLNEKLIIGGMSKYNEPSMTLQRDLFNPETVKYTLIPFEEGTYARYLESIAMCQLSLNGYSQNFMASLEELRNMVYPLVSGGAKNNNQYSNYKTPSYTEEKHGLFGGKKRKQQPTQGTQFSNNVNDTLNKMRSNNF